MVLTATRSGETRSACWAEINLDAKLWTIPASRMKARRDQLVPLSRACMAMLKELRELELCQELLFPAPYAGGPLSDMALIKLIRDLGLADTTTAHGFRSSFKNWCAEHGVSDQISEACLAHVDRDAVRAAYLRTDFLEQ